MAKTTYFLRGIFSLRRGGLRLKKLRTTVLDNAKASITVVIKALNNAIRKCRVQLLLNYSQEQGEVTIQKILFHLNRLHQNAASPQKTLDYFNGS